MLCQLSYGAGRADGIIPDEEHVSTCIIEYVIELNIPGHGSLRLQHLVLTAVRIPPGDEAKQKADHVRQLGAATEALLSTDLLLPNIVAALELFDRPSRIVASLRK